MYVVRRMEGSLTILVALGGKSGYIFLVQNQSGNTLLIHSHIHSLLNKSRPFDLTSHCLSCNLAQRDGSRLYHWEVMCGVLCAGLCTSQKVLECGCLSSN